MVRSYVGAKGRVYVFIDDLDRCEVPKAADLMQAINLLLSTNDTNLIFVLGLDREIVAAGLAAKYERLLPYLAEARIPRTADPRKDARTGLEYGYSFLEKFIQVPFHVPVPGNDDIGQWVSRLTAPDGGSRSEAAPPAADQTPQQEAFALAAGSDPEGFEAVVVKMAMVLDFNPRRIKQFVNVFRLWVSIAVQTGLLVPAGKTGANAEPAGMRIEQLGVFTAIILRWPGLAADLSQRPDLLERLIGVASGENAGEDPLLAYWASRDRLTAALRLAPPYSLRAIGVLPLLSILPNTYRGEMDFTAVTAAPARLVPGASFAAGAASAASSADVGVDGGGSSPSPAAERGRLRAARPAVSSRRRRLDVAGKHAFRLGQRGVGDERRGERREVAAVRG
jgi:hypothetical protein